MEVVKEPDKLAAMATAATRDFNDELTVILSGAALSLRLLGPDHPARLDLLDLQRAALRCADIARCLEFFTVRYSEERVARARSRNRKLV
jgi:hypothetical protein